MPVWKREAKIHYVQEGSYTTICGMKKMWLPLDTLVYDKHSKRINCKRCIRSIILREWRK